MDVSLDDCVSKYYLSAYEGYKLGTTRSTCLSQ